MTQIKNKCNGAPQKTSRSCMVPPNQQLCGFNKEKVSLVRGTFSQNVHYIKPSSHSREGGKKLCWYRKKFLMCPPFSSSSSSSSAPPLFFPCVGVFFAFAAHSFFLLLLPLQLHHLVVVSVPVALSLPTFPFVLPAVLSFRLVFLTTAPLFCQPLTHCWNLHLLTLHSFSGRLI